MCILVFADVCARLAPGSRAITLYEVWQGESKTSAHPEKALVWGSSCLLAAKTHPVLFVEFLSEDAIKCNAHLQHMHSWNLIFGRQYYLYSLIFLYTCINLQSRNKSSAQAHPAFQVFLCKTLPS